MFAKFMIKMCTQQNKNLFHSPNKEEKKIVINFNFNTKNEKMKNWVNLYGTWKRWTKKKLFYVMNFHIKLYHFDVIHLEAHQISFLLLKRNLLALEFLLFVKIFCSEKVHICLVSSKWFFLFDFSFNWRISYFLR